MTSGALWIVLLWILIIGSRPISMWFGVGAQIDHPDDYLEGSPIDRAIYLILIVFGLIALLKRKIDWNLLFTSNRWVILFFLYCGLSILWSDYPFVALKRWTKEFGNMVMIIILITDKDHVLAIRTVAARFSFVAIPLSVVLIKYYSDLGRLYNRWTGDLSYAGITTNKNELGIVLVLCGLFFMYDFIEERYANLRNYGRIDMFGRAVLLLMFIWLISIVSSSTAVVCLLLGSSILYFMRFPLVKRQIRRMGMYGIFIFMLLLLIYSVPGVLKTIVDIAGRDVTFTGRTYLWEDLLRVPINPILGKGYNSFWLGPHVGSLWEKYYFHPTQAHNGYLQAYLDGGAFGVSLLIALLLSTGRNLKKSMLRGSKFEFLRFSFYIVALFYNWTEAMFGGLNLIWFMLLVAIFNYKSSDRPLSDVSVQCENDNIDMSLTISKSNYKEAIVA